MRPLAQSPCNDGPNQVGPHTKLLLLAIASRSLWVHARRPFKSTFLCCSLICRPDAARFTLDLCAQHNRAQLFRQRTRHAKCTVLSFRVFNFETSENQLKLTTTGGALNCDLGPLLIRECSFMLVLHDVTNHLSIQVNSIVTMAPYCLSRGLQSLTTTTANQR